MATLIEEQGEDRAAVKALHRAVFGGEYEAELVERLGRDGLVVASLVALQAEVVVGHILFSDLAVTIDGRPILAAALAPLAVLPDFQRKGDWHAAGRKGSENFARPRKNRGDRPRSSRLLRSLRLFRRTRAETGRAVQGREFYDT
jgi:hypothetical protein